MKCSETLLKVTHDIDYFDHSHARKVRKTLKDIDETSLAYLEVVNEQAKRDEEAKLALIEVKMSRSKGNATSRGMGFGNLVNTLDKKVAEEQALEWKTFGKQEDVIPVHKRSASAMAGPATIHAARVTGMHGYAVKKTAQDCLPPLYPTSDKHFY